MLDLGDCHIPNSRTKPDRALITNVTAGLADNALGRQTVVFDVQIQLPGRFCSDDKDRFGTRACTVTAKGALAAPKINFGESGCTANDDALRTRSNAFVACGASIHESRLADRPGRTYRRSGRNRPSSEQIAPADVHWLGQLTVRTRAGQLSSEVTRSAARNRRPGRQKGRETGIQ